MYVCFKIYKLKKYIFHVQIQHFVLVLHGSRKINCPCWFYKRSYNNVLNIDKLLWLLWSSALYCFVQFCTAEGIVKEDGCQHFFSLSVVVSHWSPPPRYMYHRTTEYTECQAFSPVVRTPSGIGSPRPLARKRVLQGGGGSHSPAGDGLGESQFRRLEKKLSTLPILCTQVWYTQRPSLA